MKTDAEYRRIIKDPANWRQVNESDVVRTFELNYNGGSAYKHEVMHDGKWKYLTYFRFTPAFITVKMRTPELIEYLKQIDRERERRHKNEEVK